MPTAALDPPVDQRHLRRVERHITQLRRTGHTEDAEALRLVLRWAKKSLAPLKRASTPLLTTGKAAARLGVSDETVRTWARRGLLGAQRRGSRFLIPAAAVERELAAARIPAHELVRRHSVSSVHALGPVTPRERNGPLPAPGYAIAVADRESLQPAVSARWREVPVRRVGPLEPRSLERGSATGVNAG